MEFIFPCCKYDLEKNEKGNLICKNCFQEFNKIDQSIYDFIPKEHFQDKKLKKWINF